TSVVQDHQLPAALARNQARDATALLAGAPLGGVLFAAGRIVPFVFDAVSYLVSVCSLLLIRAEFRRTPRPAARTRLLADVQEGLRWSWRQPFIRATSLLVTGSDWNATVGAARLRLTPDELQGRVSSIATLFSLGLVPVASLVTGFLLDAAGPAAA